ncbi:MAG: ABC transporter ATP-binding protein [Lentisphaerae bacterium]|nr:ABC transporter ATP-binding protein [Lentisphaerota bacterium]
MDASLEASIVLRITQLGKVFAGPSGPVEALGDVSLTVAGGEFVAVQGASGSGKTTLLLAAGALLRPTSGQVELNGQNPYVLTPEQRSRFRAGHVGFVFQQFHLLPYLNVEDNIRLSALAVSDAQADPRALELMEQFGLSHRRDHLPEALSVGERQRTALARALLNRPALLLADEPTGNLDRKNAEAVLQAMKDFAAGGGAVLLVTHDAYAAEFAHRRLRMEHGRML